MYLLSGFYMQFLLRMLGIIKKKILVHVWEIRPLKTTFATLDEQYTEDEKARKTQKHVKH